jgi:hypothetical protein
MSFDIKLYGEDLTLTILLRKHPFSDLRSNMHIYVVYILAISILFLLLSMVRGYSETISYGYKENFKNVIIEVLNKEKVIFNIKEVDDKVIFKLDKFGFKRITIAPCRRWKDDKIKKMTIYFRLIKKKKAIYLFNEFNEVIEENNTLYKNKSDIILNIIFAILCYYVAIMILLNILKE